MAQLPTIPEAEACTLCGFCVQACPSDALHWLENKQETSLLLDVKKCDGCGKCVPICAFKAIVLVTSHPTHDKQIVLRRSPLALCKKCGETIASQAEMNYVVRQLGAADWQKFCLSCRSRM